MGICSKAKDVICCYQLTDVLINYDNASKNKEQKK